MKRCKECGKRVPQRNPAKAGSGSILVPPRRDNQVNFACQMLGLCRYCYGWKFPERKPKLPALRQGSRRLLSWDEHWRLERYRAFEGMEQLLWMPEFYEEWLEFQVAKRRGEICGSY